MEIKTERLTLRPIRIGDEKEIHEYAGDKSITMMFWLPNDTLEETADFVRKNAEEWNSEDQTNLEFDGEIVWLLLKTKYRFWSLIQSRQQFLIPLMKILV